MQLPVDKLGEVKISALGETGATSRAPLTSSWVVAAAVELADRNGIESISMRQLAQELNVEAMSLYTHVRNKDDLLDGADSTGRRNASIWRCQWTRARLSFSARRVDTPSR